MEYHIEKVILSIGLPVYNGENFLAKAIDSILSQTFTDFELIIADNGSTDTTPDICRDFADRDNRIQLYQSLTNIGAAANFRKVFHLSRGKYFKWAAHDDLLAPDYLMQCISLLESRKDIILCHSQVTVIDEEGKVIREEKIENMLFDSSDSSERFSSIILNDLDNYEVFGVIRRKVLQGTPLIRGFIASDRTLRAELGLRGKIGIINKPLFLCRDHPQRSIRLMPSHHTRGQWFDPNIKSRFLFPHWRILLEYCKCPGRVGLSVTKKIKCYIAALKWVTVHMNWARLIADPVLVLFPALEKNLQRIGGLMCKDSKIETP
ncbi:MAG: glycosyltransferase [Desulfobulbaceae bacterium]|nr:glycosyltransferase [Desulfobulbaceae bacterium]